MAIKGSLEEASLPDVLQLLSMGQKTGRLSVTDWTNLGYIYVDSGRITYATLVNRRDRLGDILQKSGKITEQQLTQALRLQEVDRDKKLGEALVEIRAIDRSELEHHMRVQIEEAAYFLFTWRRGNFTFEKGVQPEGQDFLVSIEPESLLLEGARRTDEWTLVEKKIPSFDLVFKLNTERLESSDNSLTDQQTKLVPLLDGTRNVASLVDESGMVEFDVGKALYELVNAGLANATGRRELEPSVADEVGVDVTGVEKDSETEHFDYVQLTAYLAREGEFGDPDRRKEAAFHITDCAVCSTRLRKIHQRRSGTLPVVAEEPTVTTGSDGHLNDLQMFTYAAREGEYADPNRRKEAAQHIADCSACSKRLKVLHRRRTGSTTVTIPESPASEPSTHLDDLQLITYAAREAEFSDPQRRREVAFHIADCATCSKRLKEIHRQRTQTVSPGPDAHTAVPDEQKSEPVKERRSGLDRRVSDARRRRRDSDRRVIDRRSGAERRVAERRGTAGKTRKRAVERRSGLERRYADRRAADRRTAERRASGRGRQAMEGRRSAAAVGSPTAATDGRGGVNLPGSGGATIPTARRRDASPSRRRPQPHADSKGSGPRKTQSGKPTRADGAAAASTEMPVVMKEQTGTLEVPKAAESSLAGEGVQGSRASFAPLLESERKSLVGLPLLDSESPGGPEAKPERETEAKPKGEEVDSQAAQPAPPPESKALAVSKTDEPPPAAEFGADAAPDETEAEVFEVELTSPRRGTPISLKGPDDVCESDTPHRRGTPVSLWKLDPDPPREGPQSPRKTGPAPASQVRTERSGLRWRAAGRWAALLAVAIAAWFARPLLQSLVGGGGESPSGAPDLATTGTSIPGERVPAAVPDTNAPETLQAEPAVEPAAVEPTLVTPARPEQAAPPTRRADTVAAQPTAATQQPTEERETPREVPRPAVTVEPDTVATPDPAPPNLSGTVRTGTGAPLAGATLSIAGTGLTAISDAAGSFEIAAVPVGSLSVAADLDGYVSASGVIVATAGSDVSLNLVLRSPPSAVEPDEELVGPQWELIDPAEAEAVLGRPAPIVAGLWLESMAKPAAGTRPRVRVSLLSHSGERIVLTVTRAGAPVRGPVPRVTAMRVIPPSEAYPVTTGTASFGNQLVTAKSGLPADSVRAMLGRLIEYSRDWTPR